MKSLTFCPYCYRRRFLQLAALGAATFFTRPGAFAEALIATPEQTEGPFYPDKLPLDTDNDLILINDTLTPAVGEITHLSGTVTDLKGTPVRNAVVEIWQVDNNANYLHTGGDNRGQGGPRDGNFQGYGRFLTGSTGEYYFRTIKPVSYPGRTPHIHVAVSKGGKRILATQCYIKGHEQNARDGIFGRLGSAEIQDASSAEFLPLPGSKAGEFMAKFDIVLGRTPADA